jgi:hypothetical protein
VASKTGDDEDFNIFGLAFGFLAASLLIATGLIASIYGLSELMFGGLGRDTDTLIHVSSKAWALVHVVAGLGLFAAGCNIFAGRFWARMTGMAVAFAVLVAGLLSFEEGPVFSIFLVVVNTLILWALWFHWRDVQELSLG